MVQYLNIIPKDIVIARDGRPFNNGNRMKSLNWFYPSVIAGTIRTMIGIQQEYDFNEDQIKLLKNIKISSTLPTYNNNLYFPRPLDCIAQSKTKYFKVKPQSLNQDEWTDLPKELVPTIINTDDDFKPYNKMPAFWKQDVMVSWLCDEEFQNINFVPFNIEKNETNDNFLSFPNKETRTHVKIEKETQMSEDGQLFQTTGLDFTIAEKENSNDYNKISISVKIEGDIKIEKSLATMGGERKTVCVQPTTDINWDCPEKIKNILNNAKFIKMVLVTPAIFEKGWIPKWLNENFEGTIPNTNVKVKLQSAVIDRWIPISGWSLENNKPRCKPIKRMVPSGSVYFFEVIKGNAQELSNLWLTSISDDDQDKKDGFGLTLFGIYK